jgi:hypothetical protein
VTRLIRAIRFLFAHWKHHREIRAEVAAVGPGMVVKCGACRREFGSPGW